METHLGAAAEPLRLVQRLEAALDQLGRTQRQRLEEGGEETGRGVGQ